jgi:periplasmic divalent cation tolerance protein
MIDSEEAAARIARTVVENRLAACAQVSGPVRSTYWWKGEIETAQEWQVLMKTTAARYADLETRIRANHSYEVPDIVATEIAAGSADYLSWIENETQPRVP